VTVYLFLTTSKNAPHLQKQIDSIRSIDPTGSIAVFDSVKDPLPDRPTVDLYRLRGDALSPARAAFAAMAAVRQIFPAARLICRILGDGLLLAAPSLSNKKDFFGTEDFYLLRSPVLEVLMQSAISQQLPDDETTAISGLLKSCGARADWKGSSRDREAQKLDDQKRWNRARRDGARRSPLSSNPLSIDAACVVADQGVADDLERLIPTFRFHHPKTPLHLIVDDAAAERAKMIDRYLGIGGLYVHRWLTEENMRFVEDRVSGLTNHADYWKPGPIWWKMAGAARILREYLPKGSGLLLVDSDIVFNRRADEETWNHVDGVFSPFYWPDPIGLQVARVPGGPKVSIATRDGHINAGYFLARRPEIFERWLELFEQGIDGFYEQACMHKLGLEWSFDYFAFEHNFGQWRGEFPRPDAISYHIHAATSHAAPTGQTIQEAADRATARARLGLARRFSLSRCFPFFRLRFSRCVAPRSVDYGREKIFPSSGVFGS
jgi:hypothetical protein